MTTTISYKYKSKIATAAGAIATIITILGVEQLNNIFPGYSQYIPVIVAICAWYLAQSTEDTRVKVAEQLIHEQYTEKICGDDEEVDDEC